MITVATKALTSQGGACSSQPKLLPLLALPLSPTGRGRARPSRLFAFAKRRSVKFYFSKNKRHILFGICLLFLAEKERFELSRRYYRPTPLAGAPLRPLEYFSVLQTTRFRVCQIIIASFISFVNTFFKNLPFLFCATYCRCFWRKISKMSKKAGSS